MGSGEFRDSHGTFDKNKNKKKENAHTQTKETKTSKDSYFLDSFL